HRETSPGGPRPARPPARGRGHHPVHRRPGRPLRRCRLQGAGEDSAGPVRLRQQNSCEGKVVMTGPFREFAELRSLLDAVCEESITAEQLRRLEELVLNHPEAEAYYVQFMSLHADLVGHFGRLPARAEQSLRDRVQTGQDQGPSTKDQGQKKSPLTLRPLSF